ncbi:MAG TPA: hypothetical protein VEK11_15965 [Thermoanaerobaculia bacterium]|nr:hypothetical protein [Thermoanaerobaculia bacterium]
MRRAVLFLVLVTSLGARAQDVLSLGTGSGSVPVTVVRQTANPIQGVAFKVLFDEDAIASLSFTRTIAGVALYESSLQGTGFFSYVVLFPTSVNVSGQIGTLTVNAQPSATPGTTVALMLDPPSAILSNKAASTIETVANGLLSVTNGSVTISGTIAAPSGVVAVAASTAAVNVSWNAVAGANHYEVLRSFNGNPYTSIGTTTGTSLVDSSVTANTTYLYRVRAVSASAVQSPLSNVDAATTIVFSEDSRIRALHFTQLRTAVNAMRASAGLAPLASDPTIATGALIRASHLTALRAGLNEARAGIGLPALSYTDTTPTIVKAAHVQELRNGVK